MDVWIEGQHSAKQLVAYILELNEQASGNLLVCFDYFDTLVSRSVYPEYTKILASGLLCQALNISASKEQIYDLRRDIELRLTNQNSEKTGELDFSLDKFGIFFQKELISQFGGDIASLSQSEFASILLEIELSVEKCVQRVCKVMLDVLTGLQKSNIKTIFVSDFYLPKPYFTEMVKHQGLTDFCSEIYVSSDLGKSKGAGTIYGELSSRHNCLPEQMLMIGDNQHADVDMAVKNGLHSVLVQRPEQRIKYEEHRRKIENGTKSSIVSNFATIDQPQIPFKETGSTFWLFIHKLFSELQGQRIKDVFFLSKEGEFLRKLFDSYQITLFGKTLIKSHYLIASRKATFVASLQSLPDENFSRLLYHYQDLSIREFLQSLNFTEDDVDQIIHKLNVNCEIRLTGLASHPHFTRLKKSVFFANIYERTRSEQRRNFRDYLQSFGVGIEVDGLNIVDVGWKGSIQDNIYHILDKNITVRGFYVGSVNSTERSTRNIKKGILFDNSSTLTKHFNVYNNNRSLFEMFLGATHGSADRYIRKSEIEGATALSDHAKVHEQIEMGGGGLQVIVSDRPEERKLYNDKIKPIQDELFQYFSKLTAKYISSGCATPSETWFARCHGRMVYLPTSSEIDFFESLYHLENFGIFELTDFLTDHNFSVIERLKNLRNIILDSPILESGIWPPVILRRFGVGFWQKVDGRKRYYREFGFFTKSAS